MLAGSEPQGSDQLSHHPPTGGVAGRSNGPMTRKGSKFNFEEALASLETLVQAMEEGELSLEESLKAFEQGIKQLVG